MCVIIKILTGYSKIKTKICTNKTRQSCIYLLELVNKREVSDDVFLCVFQGCHYLIRCIQRDSWIVESFKNLQIVTLL